MVEAPWLTIIGLGEDGLDGLPPASRRALDRAELIMAPPRHLALVPQTGAERVEWPVPFAEGLPVLTALRGRRVVVLASGDPFWFGAGAVIARALNPGEWRALPGPSTFALAAARLGWPLEATHCLGLHAAPLTRLRPHLAPGVRAIVLLRDGAAVAGLAGWLTTEGFGASALTVLEALG
ncbi:MAG: precorrin-6y C5,15-methyltransferase (decarboxylating) subunit CbiE, partial [Alphaproteobacteria bacterium]|nr:precorrin-6y C5,15-methyltransferase (decarboxylating) subunit CbiE [Alphaproteobacteria bacterium]